MEQKILVGARIRAYINNRLLGTVTRFSFSSDTGSKAYVGIDSYAPYEISSGMTKISGSIGFLRTIADGGLEGAGIIAPFKMLSREKYFSIVLVEALSNTIVFRCDKAKIQAQSWEIPAKGKFVGVANFVGIEWSNEAEYR